MKKGNREKYPWDIYPEWLTQIKAISSFYPSSMWWIMEVQNIARNALWGFTAIELNRILNIIPPSYWMLIDIQRSLMPLKAIQDTFDWIRSLYNIYEPFKSFQKWWEELERKWRHTAENLKQAGWFFNTAFLDEELANELNNKDLADNAISKIIIRYFRKDRFVHLLKMLSEWNTDHFIANRQHLISEALNAHKLKLYSASVTLLLPQIEGIIEEYLSTRLTKGELEQIKISPRLKAKKFAKVLGNTNSGIFMELGKETVEFSIIEQLYKKTDNLNKKQLHRILKRGIKKFPNRHLILHGASVNFGTEENSLKCFLFIQTLHDLTLSEEWVQAQNRQPNAV